MRNWMQWTVQRKLLGLLWVFYRLRRNMQRRLRRRLLGLLQRMQCGLLGLLRGLYGELLRRVWIGLLRRLPGWMLWRMLWGLPGILRHNLFLLREQLYRRMRPGLLHHLPLHLRKQLYRNLFGPVHGPAVKKEERKTPS